MLSVRRPTAVAYIQDPLHTAVKLNTRIHSWCPSFTDCAVQLW